MKYVLYIGAYGENSISRVTLRDGKLRHIESFPAFNASYLWLSQDAKTLYSVGETATFGNKTGGSVHSYAIGENGELTETSSAPAEGKAPCHLSIAGSMLFAANYVSGSFSRFFLNDDGTIGEALPVIRHSGSGPKADRQSAPHAHQALMTPFGSVAVADLGMDAVLFYPAAGLTGENPEPVRVSTPAGFGPRHCAFPRHGRAWYVLCELESQLLVYRGAPENAELVARVPVGDGSVPNFPAALRLSPDGTMLAATGRGQNIIDLFTIGENDIPTRLTEAPSGGDWPRDVQFSPDGRYVLCANRRSNELTAFELVNGHLEYRSSLPVHEPACILFMPMDAEKED